MTAPLLRPKSYRLGTRIFLGYLGVITFAVALMVLGIHQSLRRHLVELAADELGRELSLARAIYEADPHLHPDQRADAIGAIVGLRMTVIAPDGTVLGDSEVPRAGLPALENHSRRPEVVSAVGERMGRDVRHSSSVGRNLVYLATRTDDGTVLRLARALDEVEQVMRAVQARVAVIGLLAVLVAALLTFLVGRTLSVPIRRMADSARAMGEGELDRTVEPPRIVELGELATALNTLASDLHHRLAELEGERAEMRVLIDSMREGVLAFDPDGVLRRANPAAVEIFSLLTERGITAEEISRRSGLTGLVNDALSGGAPATVELRQHGRDLLATARPLPGGGAVVVVHDISDRRRVDAMRREFVANASHELKTPLTALRGYAETLLDDDLPLETRRSFVQVVHRNAERMQGIVDDLLDLSRIESGRWEPRPERVAVRSVVEEVFGTFAKQAERNDLRLAVVVEPGMETIQVDRSAFRLIVSNLVDNAIRYSPGGGVVTVRLDRGEESRALLSVADQGSGIPAAQLSRIFERFYRVDSARSRSEGGTGLGLSIVKHLVEAHDGLVRAESEIGQGTTILIEIPQPTAEPAEA